MNAIFIRRLLATAIILLSVSGARAQFSGFGYSFTLAGTIPDARLKNADGFSIENKERYRFGLNNFIKRFDMRPDAEMRCNGIFVTAGLILRDFKE